MVADSLDMMLPSNPDAPGHARELMLGFVAGRVSQEICQRAQLLVSELATNAVRHAVAGPLQLCLALDSDCLRVDVIDCGPGFEQPARPQPRADGGFGLYLVQQTADRWGVIRDGACRVWFELQRTN